MLRLRGQDVKQEGKNIAVGSERALASGIVVSGLALVVYGILNYLTRRQLALHLSQDAYGFFYGAFSLVTLVLSGLDFGLGPTLSLQIPKFQMRRQLRLLTWTVSAVLTFKTTIALLAGIVLISLTPWLAKHYYYYGGSVTNLALLAVSLPVAAFFVGVTDVLTALRAFTVRSALQVAHFGLIFVVLMVGLRTWGEQVAGNAYLVAYGVMASVASALLSRVLGSAVRMRPLWSWRILTRLWRTGRWFILSTVGLAVFNNLDTQLLVLLSPNRLESVALYNVALPVMQIFQSFLIVPMVFTPVAARLYHAGQCEKLWGLYGQVWVILLAGCGLVLLAGVGGAEVLIGVLFSPAYMAASSALMALLAGLFFFSAGTMNFNLLAMVGRPAGIGRAVAAGVVVNLVAAVPGIILLDITGAAFAKTLGFAAMFAVSQRDVAQVGGIPASIPQALWLVTTALALAAAGIWSGRFWSVGGLMAVLLCGLYLVVHARFFFNAFRNVWMLRKGSNLHSSSDAGGF